MIPAAVLPARSYRTVLPRGVTPLVLPRRDANIEVQMLRTYEAVLVGDRVEFTGGAPGEPGPLAVHVTVIGTAGAAGGNETRERGRAMAAALERAAAGGSFAAVADPVEWQREARQDRDLPGRPAAPPTPPDAPR